MNFLTGMFSIWHVYIHIDVFFLIDPSLKSTFQWHLNNLRMFLKYLPEYPTWVCPYLLVITEINCATYKWDGTCTVVFLNREWGDWKGGRISCHFHTTWAQKQAQCRSRRFVFVEWPRGQTSRPLLQFQRVSRPFEFPLLRTHFLDLYLIFKLDYLVFSYLVSRVLYIFYILVLFQTGSW